ncbi:MULTISPECIES: methylenetetrahydrofolate reductase [unclassified Saccharopolyspora]|uniref:methylenetetrahydrofolate reductase n=1 Tax=unclassified Saccharopolyspora TaxID=2646250 RepID=UPI001CD2545A|nr:MULTISPECIES: methylenetetrahydrofolate reductase [unclassified Saccharopolyspora]MCA1229744.1 methylenetetrahydrofolate reductase [Saccharopolyspora sp. 6M]MCA1283472.1 methylenetetrahydrofolate reductase [Saccharopolyspora sp. 7B]
MDTSTQRLRETLLRSRFEVLPVRGAAERARVLPAGSTVTVTASPAKGPEATLDTAERLAAAGLHAVPHLAGRSIPDRARLAALLDRAAALGSDEIFVVGGDSPEPAGEFPDALALLRAIEDLGRRPGRVGITAYPERHAFLTDAVTIGALAAKAPHADYAVSQICYDPQRIARWLGELRDRGVLLPVHVGLPGAVDVTKLLRVSMKIGLGESLRFLRKQHGVVTRLLVPYTPDALVDGLSAHLDEPAPGIAGWHLFTFDEIGRTARWRDDAVARLQEVPA